MSSSSSSAESTVTDSSLLASTTFATSGHFPGPVFTRYNPFPMARTKAKIPIDLQLTWQERKVNMASLFGFDTPICSSHSCKGKCQLTAFRINIKECMCDSLCTVSGDCCWDYEWECLRNLNVSYATIVTNSKLTWKGYETLLLSRSELAKYYRCFEVQVSATTIFKLNGITSCPAKAELSVVEKCENVNQTDLTGTTPVVVEDTLYRNIHCAMCHGKTKEHIIPAHPRISCRNSTDQNYNFNQNDPRGLLDYVMSSEHCVLYFDIVPKVIMLKNNCVKNVARECPVSNATSNDTYINNLTKACQSHGAAFAMGIVIYKNVFCALCNRKTHNILLHVTQSCHLGLPRIHKDYEPPNNFLPPISVLLDFSQESLDYKINVKCPPMKVQGPEGYCLEKTCPNGYMMSYSGSCLSNKTRDLLAADNLIPMKTYLLYFVIYLKINSTNWTGELLQNITANGVDTVEQCHDRMINNEMMQCLRYKTKSQFGIKEIFSRLESSNSHHLPWYIDINTINVTTYNQSNYPSCQDRLNPTMSYSYDVVDLAEFNNGTETHRVGFSLTWDSGNVTKTFWRETCLPCAMVELKKDWYTKRNKSILIEKTGHIVDDRDVIRRNTSILMCSDKFYQLFGNDSIPVTVVTSDLPFQGIVTLIGQTLSMTCLGLTLIVYSLLPSLRTLPGKGIMNLCSALFLAQLLFQINPRFTPWQTVCHVVGVLQHFFWLSAFTWMSALAFTSAITFHRINLILSQNPNFLIYLLLAWGSSALFVSVSVTVDNFQIFEIRYFSDYFCWIHNKYGLLYFFAVPLGCLLLTNIFLFATTIVGLRKTTKAASVAKSEEQSRRADKDCFMAYLKLSSIMGFGWIFGFLANLNELKYFWYVFIILSSSQGVFVFLSFALSRKVLQTFGKKFKIKCFLPKSESSSTRSVTYSTRSNREINIRDI